MKTHTPEIMAPAGDTEALLAAIAAGADVIYLGLKHFSARMQAPNFSSQELARMAQLAREHGSKVYVAMNTLVKPRDTNALARLMDRAEQLVKPEAFIVADFAAVRIAKQVGISGELHCSTLANLSHPAGLSMAKHMGFSRVVVPRELNLDEVQEMAQACPAGLDLEIFVHGALCHNVSGRCWWSSFLGGKSGLRGRCVQPCRRLYDRPSKKIHAQRLFSCMDLSLDVLTKPLLQTPQIRAWKIEGRKKGAHYVFYTVKAYQLLRDEPGNPQARKMALQYLEQALGRPSSHSIFLPQRPFQPVNPDKDTGSGKFIGKIKKEGKNFYFHPFEPLIAGDFLRIGYEDEPGHMTLKIRRFVPKGGRLNLPLKPSSANKKGTYSKGRGKTCAPAIGSRVFLIDRREPELLNKITKLQQVLQTIPAIKPVVSTITANPVATRQTTRHMHMRVGHTLPQMSKNETPGIWLNKHTLRHIPRGLSKRIWWWLPPVIWPNEEKLWKELIEKALGTQPAGFMLGAPWQRSLFSTPLKTELWAGPFCNIANAQSIAQLLELDFAGCIVSPELCSQDILDLPALAPLPLGILGKGYWPFGISRILAESVQIGETYRSPHGEDMFVKKIGQNHWLYPTWGIDITDKSKQLKQAGYQVFVQFQEQLPKKIQGAKRSSNFNWDNQLL